jgi:hypothetical protein
MQAEAELEIATPKDAVTPAPTIPAHELLGDLFLAQARPTDALAAYRRSLELYPTVSTVSSARRGRHGRRPMPAPRAHTMKG